MPKYRIQRSPTRIRLVAAVVGAILLAGTASFLLYDQTHVLMNAALKAAFGREIAYGSAWIGLNGDLRASDLVLPTRDRDPQRAARYDEATVATPGWGWLLVNMFSRNATPGELTSLKLNLSGPHTVGGLQWVASELAPFGSVTAAFLESEGCASRSAIGDAELTAMGLAHQAPTLQIEQSLLGNEMQTRTVVQAAGSARLIYERIERLGVGVWPLMVEPETTRVVSERWELSDFGFLKARNAWCAQTDQVSAGEFSNRHQQALDRLLATGGLALDSRSRAVYADFFANGGDLKLSARFESPPSRAQLAPGKRELALMLQTAAVLERKGRRTLVQWQSIPPQPIAKQIEHLPTWGVIEAERGGNLADLESKVAAPAAAANEAPALPTTPPSVPEPAAGTATPVVSAPEVSIPPEAPPAATQATPPAASAPAPEPAAPARGPRTAEEIIPEAKVIRIGAQQQIWLSWEQLADHVGDRVRIETGQGSARVAEILAFEGRSVRIRTRIGGGEGELRIQRENFRRAELLR